MSVLAIVKMTVFPKKCQELLQTLEILKNTTCQAGSGCLEYRFYKERGDENTIIMIMEDAGKAGSIPKYRSVQSFTGGRQPAVPKL